MSLLKIGRLGRMELAGVRVRPGQICSAVEVPRRTGRAEPERAESSGKMQGTKMQREERCRSRMFEVLQP